MNKEMQLFYGGKWDRAYEYFGAHPAQCGGEKGYLFRLWAPKAKSVTLAGDWNG